MIYTVCGKIKPSTLGVTLGHEHFKWEFDFEKALLQYKSRENDDIADGEAFESILPVLKDLKSYGCHAVVEASPPYGGENLKLLYALSKALGIHVIANTGWNFDKSLYDPNDEDFVHRLAEEWVQDFVFGMDQVDGQVIQPGFIKLLLDKGQLSAVDKAMLRAAVIASNKTGMPIHCHILEAHMVYDVTVVLDELRFNYNKFLWAHTDRESNLEVIEYAIKKGMWLGIDQIRVGTEKEKHALLSEVVQRGGAKKVLLSQDYDFYEEAISDPINHPCTFLFKTFLPFCQHMGIDNNLLNEILTINPSRFYDIEMG